MDETSFYANYAALPPHLGRELDLICAVMLQLAQMSEESRRRVISYIANAYPV